MDSKPNFGSKGIGLGLAVSQMIVNKFGGQINFKSKHHFGTEFMFTFNVEDKHSVS